ncbi:hypothetical protein ACWEKM_00145 [Streptomyces sp. NPDC004752]
MPDFSHCSRIREHFDAAVQYFSSDDQLLTLRLVMLTTDEIAGRALVHGPELARVATDVGIGVSVDVGFGTSSSEAVLRWSWQLLGPGGMLSDRALVDVIGKRSFVVSEPVGLLLEDRGAVGASDHPTLLNIQG